jgi:site-specific DNA-methyltransferase (adenine-specific)
MKPDWQTDDGRIQLWNRNCLEILPEIGKVDAVITSPPYNMRTRIRNGKYTERETGEHFSKKYSSFHDAMPINEYYDFHKSAIETFLQITPLAFLNIQIVTGSKEAWFHLIGDYRKNIKDIIIWDKGEGQPAMHPAVINRSFEIILCLENQQTAGRAFKQHCFDRGTMPDVWRLGRGGNGDTEGHAAVFPVTLPSRIINGWTSFNSLICDPFMGSGTTGIACIRTGRKFVGIEISKTYYELAKARIKTELQQQLLKL